MGAGRRGLAGDLGRAGARCPASGNDFRFSRPCAFASSLLFLSPIKFSPLRAGAPKDAAVLVFLVFTFSRFSRFEIFFHICRASRHVAFSKALVDMIGNGRQKLVLPVMPPGTAVWDLLPPRP